MSSGTDSCIGCALSDAIPSVVKRRGRMGHAGWTMRGSEREQLYGWGQAR
jgi:hypothetical protein